MPWKLILFLIVVALVVVFAGFNIDNTAEISFGFHTLTGIPIFVSLFAAFFLGVIVTLPVAFRHRSRKAKKAPKQKQDESIPEKVPSDETSPAQE